MRVFHSLYTSIISLDNLFNSWHEFRQGKRSKADVQEFERKLEDNIFRISRELKGKTYYHGHYTSFYITDPKLRHIHKAEVRDRIVHHAVYRVLYPIFDPSFIYDSYSCRNGKGTHRAVKRLEDFSRKVSKNYIEPCFALKCDVRKFFFSVDHKILFELIKRRVKDEAVLDLVNEIIESFHVDMDKGIPIGNLTSQLFANIYLDELDQFVKHVLKVKYYLRYCDDFVILSDNIAYLESVRVAIEQFLQEELKLSFHEDKITIRKLRQGIDFLGYVIFPHHTILRTKTKRRMLQRVNEKNLPSYLGILTHCDGHELEEKVKREHKKSH